MTARPKQNGDSIKNITETASKAPLEPDMAAFNAMLTTQHSASPYGATGQSSGSNGNKQHSTTQHQLPVGGVSHSNNQNASVIFQNPTINFYTVQRMESSDTNQDIQKFDSRMTFGNPSLSSTNLQQI